MDPNKFTQRSQETLNTASQLAREHGNPEITSAHLLLALLSDFEGVVVQLLQKLDVSVGSLAANTEVLVSKLPQTAASSQSSVGADLQKVLKASITEAQYLKDEYISREHLFLALTGVECQVSPIINSLPINRAKLLSELSALRGSHKSDSSDPETS